MAPFPSPHGASGCAVGFLVVVFFFFFIYTEDVEKIWGKNFL